MKASTAIGKIQQMAKEEKLPIEILEKHTTWFESLKEEGNPADLIYVCFENEESPESENNLVIAVSLEKGRAARYRTAVADDDFELLEEYPLFKDESELLELLKQKSREFLRDVKTAVEENQSDEDEDEMCYEMECPVCGEAICDEDGSFDECKHVLLSWNSFDGGPSYVHKDVEPLITDDLDCSDIIEEEFLLKVREKLDADVEPLMAESGLNQCLTSTPTLYAIVRTD